MATLRLEIVTPEARIFEGDVASVVIPGIEGEMQVLPGHDSLMSQIRPGELQVADKDGVKSLAVGEGFAEITGQRVSILTDMAVQAKEIDEQKMEEAVRRAQEALRDKSLGADEAQAMEAMLSKSMAQLQLKKRVKK